MDVKLPNGVPLFILNEALDLARVGRIKIINTMNMSLDAPRSNLKETAPIAEILKYDPSRKRFLLGPGGEIRNYIEETYACEIDLSENGLVYIYGTNKAKVRKAFDLVQDLVVVLKEGDVLTAEVLEVKDYGAIVKITRAQEAILHVSEITHDKQLSKKSVNLLLSVGQRLKVKVNIDLNSLYSCIHAYKYTRVFVHTRNSDTTIYL